MGRVTEFMHFINLDRKTLHLGKNLKEDSYTHITIRMKTKRARYEHQNILKQKQKEQKESAKKIRDYFRKDKK